MKRFAMIAVIFALGGCTTIQPVSSAAMASSTAHQVERNYTIGQEASVFVGQPLVRVKDYWVSHNQRAVLKASDDFVIRMPPFGMVMRFPADQPSQVTGTQERDGKQYRVVQLPGLPTLGFLLNDDGTFDGRAVNFTGAKMGFTYRPDPATVKLLPTIAEEVSTDRGYVNFEIVYSGATKDEISLLYREYTPQDLARPAFTQNLTYARDTGTIRFRDLKITLLSADNERIRYIVQEDGLTAE